MLESITLSVFIGTAIYGDDEAMNWIEKHPLEMKIGLPIIVLGIVFVRWAYCLIGKEDSVFCQGILSSLGANFFVLGVTIMFVDKAIKSYEMKKYLHKRADQYVKIRQILFCIDQIFLELDYGAHYRNKELIMRVHFDFEHVKQTLEDLIVERRNINNCSGKDKSVMVKISENVDKSILCLCDETKQMLTQIGFIDVSDLDNDIVRKLHQTIDNSFIDCFSRWYNWFYDAANYNSCVYVFVLHNSAIKETVDNINVIRGLAMKMFEELSKDKRFSDLQPPVFTNVIT